MRGALLFVALAMLAAACTPPDRDDARTPLPTRQTTIDVVNKKLEAAKQDAERRLQEADQAGK
jgi:hypothetical protein